MTSTAGHLPPDGTAGPIGTEEGIRVKLSALSPSIAEGLSAVEPLVIRRGWIALRSPLVLTGADVMAVAAYLVLTGQAGGAAAALVVLVPLWLCVIGNYRSQITRSIQVDFFPLAAALALSLILLGWFDGDAGLHLLRTAPLLLLIACAARSGAHLVQRRARSLTADTEPTLILGAGVLGCKVADALLDHPEYGMRPIGFVDDFVGETGLPLPVIGNLGTLGFVLDSTRVSRVIVAFGGIREAQMIDVLRTAAAARVQVHILPRLFELGIVSAAGPSDMVWGFPLQHARRSALASPAWRTKRVLDIVVSSVALLVSLPVLAAAVAAVKLTSPGPVFFRQRRVGQTGHIVTIYKLRSMRINEDSDNRWGSRSDDRVTKVGKLLRATSIDELPQLFNVLRGDMSLVGPRPERPLFSEEFSQRVYRYKDRLRVPVGLTGWAQVHGLRGDTSIEERARFDNYYIEHWSLWLDLVILARTGGQVVREVLSWLAPASDEQSPAGR